MKFKTDENLPASAAALLRSAGHDVATALDEELSGIADPQLAEVCRKEGRALLTLDRGLGDIRAYPPADYAGIVVLRTRNQEVDTLLALVRRLIALLAAQPLAGALWIVRRTPRSDPALKCGASTHRGGVTAAAPDGGRRS